MYYSRVFTIIILMLALGNLSAQDMNDGCPDSIATNVAIGRNTIMACYDSVDFVLDSSRMTLFVCSVQDGQTHTESVPARVFKTRSGTWYAIANGGSVQIDPCDGRTVVMSKGRSMTFSKPYRY